MRTKFLLLIFFFILAFLLGCDKEDVNIIDGTYKGTFTVTYYGSDVGSGTHTGQTTLELKNGKFSSSGHSNRIPAGGSGTFLSDNNKMTFIDESVWTAEFDWGLILTGKYDYTFNGIQLNMSAEKKGVGRYEYNLERE